MAGERKISARVLALGAACFLTLASCAARQSAQYGATDPSATIQPVYVATQRDLNRTGQVFGEERPRGLKFFRNDISIPARHTPGLIEWPKGKKANAATDFVVTGTKIFTNPAQMKADMGGSGETLVFVHGYNNTLSDAMYRMAQIETDFKTGMPGVVFSWPSAGDARGYIYDRDSALYSRNDLEDLLKALTQSPNDKVFLLAHSMGAHLAMETLRQIALRGDQKLMNKISGVVLMSPDIDPDLFRSQARTIGKLPQPFMIFVSQTDRALTAAGLLTGRKQRLGLIDGPESVEGLDVTVVDFTALGDGEGLNHMVPVSSPAGVKVLQGMIANSGRADTFEKYIKLSLDP
ncbi:alpha/beta fold hydrolase [Roseovarius aestuarii]|nr:alpha/beta fold hydrolase [Roseovarius aestuarii]